MSPSTARWKTGPTARRAASVLFALLALGACASLPPLEPRTASTALTGTEDTSLGQAVAAAAQNRGDESGIYPLWHPRDGFAARILLARRAERSLDLQYYIWHNDVTGILLLEELWNAAARGVRVRLLIDDNGTGGMDAILAAFNSRPGIEVRIYNPFPNRSVKVVGFLTDFQRLNHRMHNKSFTADSQATIVGGRNIGDEYFGAGQEMVFFDMGVVAVGPIARDVSTEFDGYWNSVSAYPAERVVGRPKPGGVEAMMARFEQVRSSSEAAEYLQAVRETRVVESFLAHDLQFEWSRVTLLADPPDKTLGKAPKEELVLPNLKRAVGDPEHSFDLVSPYFVPGKQGTRTLSTWAESGVRLRIVTNSLASTDSSAVHAGYAKSREALVRSGVRLYELKPDPNAGSDPARRQARKGSGSSASLHAKTLASDRSRAFVGSFNMDPRSEYLNTEMGVVIEDAEFSGAISDRLDRVLDSVAYQVVLAPDGRGLEWIEWRDGKEIRYRTDPKTGFFKRFVTRIIGWLGIDWLL